MNLYFVRHGETEWNVENRLQGHLDSQLTKNGIRDASLLAEKLASTKFESVISSPSKRAVHTAELLIGSHPLTLETDKRLMEINLGTWQGKTINDIKAIDSYTYECYIQRPNLYMREEAGAENIFDVKARLEAFLKSMEERYQTGDFLIITHGVVVKVLQMICKKNDIHQVWEPPAIDGTSLTIVKIRGGKRELIVEGDVSHKVSVP